LAVTFSEINPVAQMFVEIEEACLAAGGDTNTVYNGVCEPGELVVGCELSLPVSVQF